MKSKHEKDNSSESLLNVFLASSQRIDEDIKYANEIIRQGGSNPETVVEEGMALILSLQKKSAPNVKVVRQLSLAELSMILMQIGLPNNLIKKRFVNEAILKALGNGVRAQQYINHILSVFGIQARDTNVNFAVDRTAMNLALFKAPLYANVNQIRAYSHYAYYLAKLIVKNRKRLATLDRPDDIDEFRTDYLSRYRSFDFKSLVLYAWELGFCVLPLNDSGVFHGACWNINGIRVIVLKQNTKYHARWIFDLLHEMYHALAHLDEPESSIIETQELNPFINNDTVEEREANTFAHQVLFGDRTEELLTQCVQQTRGKMERLKAVVQTIARKENIREDILANYVAYRLSLDDQNWWGSAASMQLTHPDPFRIARDILNDNISTGKIGSMDYELLSTAISNN